MAVPALPPFAVAPITYKDGGTIGASRLETHPTADGFANPLVDHVRALWDQAEALRVAVNGVSTNVGLLGSQAPVGALITGGRDDGTWGALTGAPGVLRYDETQPRGVRWSRTLPSPGWVTVPLGTNWYHYGPGLRARLLQDDRVELSGWINDLYASGAQGDWLFAVLPAEMRPTSVRHLLVFMGGGQPNGSNAYPWTAYLLPSGELRFHLAMLNTGPPLPGQSRYLHVSHTYSTS